MRTKLSLTLACAASATLGAACGDNRSGDIDAPEGTFDGRTADANVDSPPAQIIGQMSYLEATVYQDIGASIAPVANGPAVRLAFIDPAATGLPVMQDDPGSPFGCKAWEYNPAQFAATFGGNLGAMEITMGDDTPAVPPCSFVGPPLGYSCPDTATVSPGDNAVMGVPGPAAGTATYTDPDITFSGTRSPGRYLTITGATDAANNGAFPIVAVAGANTVVIYNPAAVASTAVGGTAVEVFGVGPSPGLAAVDFIDNDDTATFAFTTTNPAAMPTFTSASTNAGDGFTMNQANLGTLTGIPLDGTAFTIDCATCGSANSSVLNVLTTDGDITGLPGTSMPAPVTKAVLIRCTNTAGLTEVTVPAPYSAYLMSSGATRVQATFVRGSTAAISGVPLGKMAIVFGHSAVGFTTP